MIFSRGYGCCSFSLLFENHFHFLLITFQSCEIYGFSSQGIKARDLGRVVYICERGWVGLLSYGYASNKLVLYSSMYDSECFLHFRV